jgi:hypothetical protein
MRQDGTGWRVLRGDQLRQDEFSQAGNTLKKRQPPDLPSADQNA